MATANGEAYFAALSEQKLIVSCTMIDFDQEDYSTLESIQLTGGVAPDDCWPANQERFKQAVAITDHLKVKYLSMHAGYIDHAERDYAQKCLIALAVWQISLAKRK
jgi:hypothetical protein